MNLESNPLLRKLQVYGPMRKEEQSALHESMARTRRFAAREDLIHEGSVTEGVFVILSGFACRYKLMTDGRRQIVGYLLPGDMCDLRVFLLKYMDHSISALAPVEAAVLPPSVVNRLISRSPRLMRALWWTTLVEDSITREWVVNVGQRTAFERVGHLFCEVFCRLEAIGLTHGNECTLPITQMELADTLALSVVHVNRTLMYMRRAGLLQFANGKLTLLDRAALESSASFDRGYLHLEGGAADTGAAMSGHDAHPYE